MARLPPSRRAHLPEAGEEGALCRRGHGLTSFDRGNVGQSGRIVKSAILVSVSAPQAATYMSATLQKWVTSALRCV
jgi:hypothetical protein